MNWNLLKNYLKKSLIGVPVLIVVFLLLYYLLKVKLYAYGYLILWVIALVEGFFTYSKRQLYLADLERKGLTEKEINTKAFMAQWGENRERGIYKYCIIDGGIISGALLSIGVAIIGMFILGIRNEHIFSGPGEIFSFIGYTYLIGVIIGILSYRITWWHKQKMFNRLTEYKD